MAQAVLLAFGALLAILACSGSPPDIERLMLRPEDFPGIPVTQGNQGYGAPSGR